MVESGRRAVADDQYRQISRLLMQPLLYEIASHMNSSISRAQHRFALYSGHDSTVEPLANALGISDGLWPRYASRLVFELYAEASDNKLYIRILYNGRVVTGRTQFCEGQLTREGLCPIAHFLAFVEDHRFNGGPGRTGYSNACQNK